MQYPKIYFQDISGPELDILQRIVLRHKGTIEPSADVASHIITSFPEIDMLPEEVSDEYVRPLEVQINPKLVKVHWLFYPDSYDEIVSRDTIADVESIDSLANLGQSTSVTGSSGVGGSSTGTGGGTLSRASSINPTVWRGKTQWVLATRFLYDCDVFNEWGNEQGM